MKLLKLLQYTGLVTVVNEVRKGGACEDVLHEGVNLWRVAPNRQKRDTTTTRARYQLTRLWIFICALAWALFGDLVLMEKLALGDLLTYWHLSLIAVQFVATVLAIGAAWALCRFFPVYEGGVVFHELVAIVDGSIQRRNLSAKEASRAKKARILLALHRSTQGGKWCPYSRADELAVHNRLSSLIGRICDVNDSEHNPLFANMRAKERADVVIIATAANFMPSEREVTAALERRMNLVAARAGFMMDENRDF